MKLYLELFILGLPIAGLFALLATGVIMIYRASRILTLAQGGVAMFTAYVLYQLSHQPAANTEEKGFGLPLILALPLALIFAAALGYVIERFLLRPLRDRPVLVSVIMTVGVLALLTGLAGIIWGYDRQEAPQITPTGVVSFAGITIPVNQLFILGATAVIMFGVLYLFKYTTLGIAMRAVADDRKAALLMGIPADRVASLTWILGSVLAGMAGILLSPIVALHPLILTLLSIPAYAAALFGGLTNLGRMLLGAGLVGVIYSMMPDIPRVGHLMPGMRELAIFGFVIVFMFITGKSTQLQEEEI
ncbi:MAG: branched-chain amino acid ABC transporter permease [Actinomycetota bacterium]